MNPDARKWFADVASHYATDFDLYYLCFVAGIATHRKERPPKSVDLIDHYPREFAQRGRLLVGLLLATELDVLGIGLTEREAVRKNVRGLVESNGLYLSSEGARLMNQYAYGGWLSLCEHFDERPRTIESFVRVYAALIKQALDEQGEKKRKRKS